MFIKDGEDKGYEDKYEDPFRQTRLKDCGFFSLKAKAENRKIHTEFVALFRYIMTEGEMGI